VDPFERLVDEDEDDEDDDDSEPPLDADPESDVADFDSVELLSVELLAELEVALRSFLAQPEPLNTTDGALKPFVIRPSAPHDGQKRGPSAWIPWMTSRTCPHAPQT
jgi:hypothetical protein